MIATARAVHVAPASRATSSTWPTHPPPPAARARHVAARHAQPAAGGPGPGRRRRPHLRRPRRHQGAGPTGARPPPAVTAEAQLQGIALGRRARRDPAAPVPVPHRRERRSRPCLTRQGRLTPARGRRGLFVRRPPPRHRRALRPRRRCSAALVLGGAGRRAADPGPHRRVARAAPARVHAGTPSRVDLRVAEPRHPPLAAAQPARRRRRAPRGAACWSARSPRASRPGPPTGCPTERRGILTVGPLEIELTDPFGLAQRHDDRVGRVRAHRLPPRSTTSAPLPLDHRQRSAGRRRAPELARPRRRGLLRPARLRGRRRPAPRALAVDGPPRRADGPPGRAALAGPGHRAGRRARRRPTPPTRSSWSISAAASIVAAERPAARTSSAWCPPTAPTRASPPATPTSRRSWSTWPASRPPTTPPSGGCSTAWPARPPAAPSSWSSRRWPSAELERLGRLRPRFGSLTIVQFDRSSWDRRTRRPRPSTPRGPAWCGSPRGAVRGRLEPAHAPGPQRRRHGLRAHHAGGPGHRPGRGRRPARRLGHVGPAPDRPARTGTAAHDRHRHRTARPRRARSRRAPARRAVPARAPAVPAHQPAAEWCLALVTLAVIVGFTRVFSGGTSSGPLVVTAAADPPRSRSLARRRGLGLWVTTVLAVVGFVVMASWLFFAHTTRLLLPTPGHGRPRPARRSTTSWTAFQEVVAPTPPQPGFMLVAALGVCFAVFLADWAAFRLWAPIEALVPTLTLLRVHRPRRLEPRPGRPHRALRRWPPCSSCSSTAWPNASARPSGWPTRSTAARPGCCAPAHRWRSPGRRWWDAVVGTHLPGCRRRPGWCNWHGNRARHQRPRHRSARWSTSGAACVDQTDTDAVHRDQPQAGLLAAHVASTPSTASIWKSSGTLRQRRRPPARRAAHGHRRSRACPTRSQQTFNDLGPVRAVAARRVRARVDRRPRHQGALPEQTRPRSSSTPTCPPPTARPTRSARCCPRFTPDELRAADHRAARLDRPPGRPGRCPDLSARRRGAGPARSPPAPTTPYDKAHGPAVLLPDTGGFIYDPNVDPGPQRRRHRRRSSRSSRGYCEQFAGTFAAMARAVGLPARVAVGFTPGVQDPPTRPLPGQGRARPRLARGVPGPVRLGAVRADAGPRRARRVQRGSASPRSRTPAPAAAPTTSPPPPPSTAAPAPTINPSTKPNNKLNLANGGGTGGKGGGPDLGAWLARSALVLLAGALVYLVVVPVGSGLAPPTPAGPGARRPARRGCRSPGSSPRRPWPWRASPRRRDQRAEFAGRAGHRLPDPGGRPRHARGRSRRRPVRRRTSVDDARPRCRPSRPRAARVAPATRRGSTPRSPLVAPRRLDRPARRVRVGLAAGYSSRLKRSRMRWLVLPK